jgi:hypothetical protein
LLVQPRLAGVAIAVGAALAVAGLAGCGGQTDPGHVRVAPVEREWVDNAGGVIAQLSGDVSAAEPARPGLAGATRSLENLSELYGLLVAYTDFGGCTKMVSGIGTAPPRFAAVGHRLGAACARFERAATLFTRAASGHDPRALIAATREVKAGQALLYRATLAFAAARSAPGG